MPNFRSSTSLFEAVSAPAEAPTKREAILAAAGRVFIEHGFGGTSMDLVANTAGVARRTLYNQFPDGKESLFSAVTERMWSAFPAMDIATDEDALADPEVGLRRIGHAVASFWAPPLAVAFLRMVIAEGPRFPDLTRRFFEIGKTPAVNAVRGYVAEIARRGFISADNTTLATTQFLGMIDESVLWVRLMGDPKELSSAEVDEVVEQAVRIFLGHYRAPASAAGAKKRAKAAAPTRRDTASK